MDKKREGFANQNKVIKDTTTKNCITFDYNYLSINKSTELKSQLLNKELIDSLDIQKSDTFQLDTYIFKIDKASMTKLYSYDHFVATIRDPNRHKSFERHYIEFSNNKYVIDSLIAQYQGELYHETTQLQGLNSKSQSAGLHPTSIIK